MTMTAERPPAPEQLPSPRRLGSGDILRLGAHGMRTRPLRAVLSALGIAIGIAAMIAVVSIPASSNKALADQLAALGPNLLTVKPGKTFFSEDAKLPTTSVPMVKHIKPVTGACATGSIKDATVRRNDKVNASETSGLAVLAAELNLLQVLNGSVNSGKWLDDVKAKYPTVVLGSVAATRLGITSVDPANPPQVWIGGQWFTVVGVLNAMPLAPEIERSVLVGWDAAKQYLGFKGDPGTVYVRAKDSQVNNVRNVLAATVNPKNPNEVEVARPSDALKAQKLAEDSFSALFLALGGVALLVGGVGVANTMVISVLERRREIGLRRALGATKRQVRGQFLAESVLLSGLGGLVGVVIGVGVTAVYALGQHWPAVLPPEALAGGVAISCVVGAIAGAYPAMRAARLPPTQALS
ncbi:ABC transporter permease [Kibdelosporangium lantanae]